MHLLRQIYFQPWRLLILPPVLAPLALMFPFLLASLFTLNLTPLGMAVMSYIVAFPICLVAHYLVALPVHWLLSQGKSGYGKYALVGYLIGVAGWEILFFFEESGHFKYSLLFATPALLQSVLVRAFRRPEPVSTTKPTNKD